MKKEVSPYGFKKENLLPVFSHPIGRQLAKYEKNVIVFAIKEELGILAPESNVPRFR